MKRILYILMFCAFGTFSAMSQKIEIIPVDFNSSDDDFGSYLTQNGRQLYFTSERSGEQKVYYVEKSPNGWTFPEALSKDINSGSQNGACALTPDGQYIVFAAYEHDAGSEGRTDLFSARKIRGEWTDVQNLGPMINSEYWDSQPTLSSDGTTLLFVSNRPGGQGKTDIYISKRTREGWLKAKNAGSVINSSADDMSPQLASDNKTFSFASNRGGGQGGFDIYFCKYSNDNFTEPRNAGIPINSPNDDMFYYILANTKIAYFSSDRSGGKGGLDIYMAVPNPHSSEAIVVVSGVVKDEVTKQALGANITITDLRTGKKVADLRSDDITGIYYVVLQPGRNYSITASKNGYLFYSEKYEVPESEEGKEINNDISLSPLSGSTRLLIFFDFDKSELKDESVPEMERLIEFMRDNPNVKVQIEGHTDNVGDPGYNEKLSLSRANAVKDYLIKSGVESARIKTMGYGPRKPLVNANTEEARARNRRVELRIIE